jgi:DNA repair protein RadC
MMEGIFNPFERELIDAARLVLSDGVERLKGRENLFPCKRGRAERKEAREAREVLTEKLIADYGSLRHEVAIVVLMDAQGRLITIEEMPQGKATSVEMRPEILARMILDNGAAAVLLAHNHPSGDNTPSAQDVRITEKLREWLAFMNIGLIDHLVLNGADCSSIMGDWL